MKLRQFLLICSLLIGLSGHALAAKWPLEVSKGATVVVKAPLQFWKAEGPSFSTGAPIFWVDAAILDKQDWESAGLPYFGEFVVTKVFEFKPFYKLKYTDVELRNSSTWVKLRFQPGSDIARGFQALTFTGTWSKFEASDYFKNVVFGTVAARIFTGPFAKIPDPTKLALLRIAGTGLATVTSETYKDKVYVGFTFPLSGTVYNSIKLNEGARAATVINSRLAMLKSLAILVGDAGVDGVKISENILYRNFVSETVAKTDNLQYYAPLPAISQFSSADITSQQFVDQCVVILNDNRIQVSLSSGS
ncbi:MAG: hypothetical protein ACLP6G_04360 [Terriglobales bacterium]